MPKVMKQFKHEKQTRGGGFESRYDWGLILGGGHILMERGTDYPAEGTRASDAKDGSYKKGDKYDRTDNTMWLVKLEADKRNKSVTLTKVDKAGKPNTEDVHGFVVTARDMTAEEIAARDKRREEHRAKKAAAETNGSQTHNTPAAAAGVAPE